MAAIHPIDDSDGREVAPEFSIAAGWGGNIHTPVHESLTLAALINTGYNVAQGTTLSGASDSDWEYVRGAVWNDDPACLLFNDTSSENHDYSSALEWGIKFKLGESQWANGSGSPAAMQNITGRSHWGDLQFLHCMASKAGEQPADTKAKFMTWLQVMWKLANGEDGITPDTIINNTALNMFFPPGCDPAGTETLRYLLSGGSSYSGLNIQRRALGSMFHFIEDSYALGHTRRTLLNAQDVTNNNPLQFKSGVADQWGAIENFHVYDGQNESLHSSYDHSDVPIPNPSNLNDLDQFNGLIGCRSAVNSVIGLIQLMQAGKTWDTGVSTYLDTQVFPISPNATIANTDVWP